MSKPRPLPDPLRPLASEATYYLAGESRLAIQLYAERIRASETGAEDKLRAHLSELGFKELPPVHIPRVN